MTGEDKIADVKPVDSTNTATPQERTINEGCTASICCNKRKNRRIGRCTGDTKEIWPSQVLLKLNVFA